MNCKLVVCLIIHYKGDLACLNTNLCITLLLRSTRLLWCLDLLRSTWLLRCLALTRSRLLSIVLLTVLSNALLLLYQIKKAWEVAYLWGIIDSIQEQVLLNHSVWLGAVGCGVLNILDFIKYFWNYGKICRLWYVY